MLKDLHTPQLDLIPCDQPLLQAILQGRQAMKRALGVDIPENWTAFGLDPIVWTLDLLKQDPAHLGWITYMGIHRADQRLVSTCGYKGKPDASGTVEIGYEMHPDYRERGLATEAARTLVRNALSHPGVQHVIAHTMPYENASCAVLRKAGLAMTGTVEDPDDGPVWRWQASVREIL